MDLKEAPCKVTQASHRTDIVGLHLHEGPTAPDSQRQRTWEEQGMGS